MENNHIPEVDPQADPVVEPANPIDAFIWHQRRAAEEAMKAVDAMIPPGVREHGREAGRHFARGFKVLVDAAITELEKVSKEMEKNRAEGSDRPSTTGPTKVKVQVE